MLLLGATPTGRFTEQHDIFFGIGESLKSMVPQMEKCWPGTKLHIDVWREVTNVDGYSITVVDKKAKKKLSKTQQLYFLNLGGYKENEFEEFHYKMLTVAADKGKAVQSAKKTIFYKHTGLPGTGSSHIDDRYGVDVDDIFAIDDILPVAVKKNFSVQISDRPDAKLEVDKMQLGYLKWSKIK